MSRFLDFDQPIFFTPPTGKESGPRRLHKGGGGGSGTPYYAQQDRLFGTQADISQQLYNQYSEMAPSLLSNTSVMVDDAMDGTLANQMRQKAGNDAAAANANALASTNRNMQRMGANFSTDRMLSEMNKSSIMGAANTAGTLNSATAAAEDMKWNRNAGAYGQISGMGTGAMAGMGSAGAGYGNMAAQSNANSMANAQGFGKFGSAIAGIGMGYANGGEVKCNKFASGAYVRKPFVNHLKPIDWRNMPTTEQGGGNGVGSAIGSMAMGAAPILAVMAAKDLMSKDSKIIGAGKKLFSSEKPVADTATDTAAPIDADTQAVVNDSVAGSSPSLNDQVSLATTGTTVSGSADPTKESLSSMIGKASAQNSMSQNLDAQHAAKQFLSQGDEAAKEIARQQAEEEARRIAAEQAAQATQTATSSMDGAYARGGFIKRGVKLAMGGFAKQIDSGSFESDPDRFKTKPLTAAEQVAQRAGNGLMAAATNPLTYTRGYDKYQQILAKEAKNKSFVDSNPETPGVAETSPVEAPAQVQEVPLQEQAMTPQQEYSQAFSEATAPQETAPIDAQAAEAAQAVTEAQPSDAPAADGAAPIVDGAAPSADGATVAADGAAPVADGAANADTSFISSVADTPGVAEVAPVADMGADVTEKALAETTGAATTDAAGSAMDGAGAAVPVVKGLADIASGRDAGEAVADAAAGYAGAEAGAAVGSVAGPVGTVVGGVLGGVLGGSLFADGGEVLSNNQYQTNAIANNKALNSIFPNGFGNHVRDKIKDAIPLNPTDPNYVHRTPITQAMAFIDQKQKEFADLNSQNEVGQRTNITTDLMNTMRDGFRDSMPEQSVSEQTAVGTDEPTLADGGEVDPYAHAKQEEEIDMWERMQRNAERGPGDDVMHMTGTHQEGELNDQQKIASYAGDPGAMMLLKAEGGDIERADFTPGGDVQGAGTETSDDIPAWLSDGEIVENAEAVKLAGKDSLLAINDAGLEVRDGKATPKEAQAKIGQVMIERGKELTAGSGFVKRGVKLAGGGFLGGNLGVALGAGVDQYNVQSARNQQRELADRSYELQKQNADRLKEAHDLQIEEAKAQRAEKASFKDAMNKANDEIISANALQDRLNQLTPEESKAAANAYKQAGMTPSDMVRKGAAEVAKVDLAKGMALSDAAQRDIYSKTFNALVEQNAPLDDQLNALGTIDPKTALTLRANMKAKDDHVEALKERTRLAEMRTLYGNGRSGSSSRSGSGAGDKINDYEKAARETIEKALPDAYALPIGKDGKTSVSGTDLRPLANTFFSEILASKNPQTLSPDAYDRAAMQAIGMAKSAAGGDGDYRMTPDIDPVTGKYKVQITNRNGTAESTVHGGGGTGVANPTEFMSGTPQERQAALSQLRARAAKQYAESQKIDIAAMAAFTPADIEASVAEAKRAGKDERMAREAITNYVGHAKEYMLLNPPKKAGGAGASGGKGDPEFGWLDKAKLVQLEMAERNGNLANSLKGELNRLRELKRLQDLKENGTDPWYRGKATREDSAAH